MPDETRGGPSGDPRTQVGPYRYELYAVTNHRGQLNSGHYTAHVQSSGDWYHISDTNISRLTSAVVVSPLNTLSRIYVDNFTDQRGLRSLLQEGE
ncbi:hypothetical protein C0995_014946 [Termitomyces sp. Mi166|nr:hypothetical protein C0995_014946 [Termitomyces sp. Mi166\